jgi:hypothetical protein
MHTLAFPPSKSGLLLIENFPIPNKPNIPNSHDHNLHEKGVTKTMLGNRHYRLQIINIKPRN